MMIGSCGHELKDRIAIQYRIAIKEHDREGKRCIGYIVVCKKCYLWYKKKKLILRNEKEENKWLTEKKIKK